MTKRIISYVFVIISVSIFCLSCKNVKKQKTDIIKIDFSDKQDYNFLKVDDTLSMAYLDIGNSTDPIVLLLHGEPNSSFVYRNIAPAIVKSGFRVIVPDLIGFGNSDKPINAEAYTYSNHTKWLQSFIDKLDLNHIHLFAHDWGAMISLRIIAEKPEKFKKVAISYGYLFEGTEEIPEGFEGFKNYAKNEPNFSAGDIMNWGSYKILTGSIKNKYDEPFKGTDFIAARQFPWLIPDNPNDKEAILNKKLNQKLKDFNNPFITIWGSHIDPMWTGKDSILQQSIKGAKNQTHYILQSNHFVQEDKPENLAQILINFFKV